MITVSKEYNTSIEKFSPYYILFLIHLTGRLSLVLYTLCIPSYIYSAISFSGSEQKNISKISERFQFHKVLKSFFYSQLVNYTESINEVL